MITIRAEISEDIVAVRHVLEMAFGQDSEARLVEALRQADALDTSLVAVEKEQIVAHIAFSAVVIESAHATVNVVALAPLAVLPSHQRRGIGIGTTGFDAMQTTLPACCPCARRTRILSALRFHQSVTTRHPVRLQRSR